MTTCDVDNCLSFLVVESESEDTQHERRSRTGYTAAESYILTLKRFAPNATFVIAKPSCQPGEEWSSERIARFDGVFISGSPLHIHGSSPDVQREIDFMKKVFRSATPSFGSCAGLQIAAAASGGRVRAMKDRQELGFARRIYATPEGTKHPLFQRRAAVWDACAIHSDEVESLPVNALVLASNDITAIQAAEISFEGGIFWGVQYHPELSISEIASALRKQSNSLVESGVVSDEKEGNFHINLIESLGSNLLRRDLAWQLGLNEQVTDFDFRTLELRNFIKHLVIPIKISRAR